MPLHTHAFVEAYTGLVGFGLDRQTDENTIVVYLQKFSDDALMETLKGRMSDGEMESLFTTLTLLLKRHLSEAEYHRLFLKEAVSA